MYKSFLLWILCFALLFYASGCRRGITRVSIEGKVTYQGQPLNGGEITFRPGAGPGCGAVIDEKGTFKVDKSYGPMPGSCQIMIEKIEEISVKGSDGRVSAEKNPLCLINFIRNQKQSPWKKDITSWKSTLMSGMDDDTGKAARDSVQIITSSLVTVLLLIFLSKPCD